MQWKTLQEIPPSEGKPELQKEIRGAFRSKNKVSNNAVKWNTATGPRNHIETNILKK